MTLVHQKALEHAKAVLRARLPRTDQGWVDSLVTQAVIEYEGARDNTPQFFDIEFVVPKKGKRKKNTSSGGNCISEPAREAMRELHPGIDI